MTALGLQLNLETARRADRYTGQDELFYTFAGNTLEWCSFELEIPSDILDAVVVELSVESRAAATPHEVDPGSLREVCRMTVHQLGEAAGRGVYVSEPIVGMNDAADAAIPNGWFACFRELSIHVTRQDTLNIVAPPPDDNVSPTGDYFAWLRLMAIVYSKR